MNYAAHYQALVDRARRRALLGYSERHHVVPRALGGTDAPVNIVRLTPEEHYVAHQLLVKMYPRHAGLLGAAMMMGSGSQFLHRRNKVYGWLRRRWAERMRTRHISPETIAAAATANRGKVRTAEFKDGVRRFHTGRQRPASTGAKISAAAKARFADPAFVAKHRQAVRGQVWSDARRQRKSEEQRGRTHSQETRLKMRATRANMSPEIRARMSAGQRKRRLAERAAMDQPKMAAE